MGLATGVRLFRRSRRSSTRGILIKTALAATLLIAVIVVGATPVKETPAVTARPALSAEVGPSLSMDVAVVPPIGSALPSDLSSKKLSDDELAEIRENLRTTLGTISFIRNDGQWDDSVLWIGRSLTGNVLVERDGLRLVTPQDEQDEAGKTTGQATHVWALKFENSPGIEEIVPQHWATTKYSFFRAGHSASNVPAAAELLLKDVYPGIDLRLYSQEGSRLEFDWIVEPGADYRQIQLRAQGPDGVELTSPDQIVFALRQSDVRMEIPEAYQIDGDEKVPVRATLAMPEPNLLAYHVAGDIDPSLPLVIDPDLDWGTYFDGDLAGFDHYLFAITVAPCAFSHDQLRFLRVRRGCHQHQPRPRHQHLRRVRRRVRHRLQRL